MLLSIVIPFHNCENFIETSINCILCEFDGVCDYEIILVDDESTDRGHEIGSEYAERHHNIVILSQKRAGPATARNVGLRHARGEYVWFIDADDSIESGAGRVIADLIRCNSNADMISFNYRKVYNDNTQEVCPSNYEGHLTGEQFLKRCYGGMYLWYNIFKRQSVKYEFIDGTYHIEDKGFIVKNAIHFDDVLCIPEIVYNYNCKNSGSISKGRSIEQIRQSNIDAYRVHSAIFLDAMAINDAGKRNVLMEVVNFGVAGHFFTMMNQSPFSEIKKYLSMYSQLGLYPIKRTSDKKANIFAAYANIKYLFLLTFKIGRLFYSQKV